MNPEITPDPSPPKPGPATTYEEMKRRIQAENGPPPPSFAATLDLQPLGRPATFAAVIEALLKQPGRILHECKQGGGRVAVVLAVAAVLCLVVFGTLLGFFSGGTQHWAAPVKIVLGVVVSVVICLPSLYIFSALGGMDGRVWHVAGLLLATIALTSVLLLGFAPVVWIFSQSTESVAFIGFLALAFWIISLLFGFRLLLAAASRFGLTVNFYLVVWMGIFLVVTLQMATALRPIIGTAGTFLPTQKKFFLEHWVDQMNVEESRGTWKAEQYR